MNNNTKKDLQIEKIEISNKNFKDAYNSKLSKFAWLGNWLEKESTIFKNEGHDMGGNKPNFKRGEIIKVDFGINIGSELSNVHFAIVLNDDDNNNVDNITVLPLTSKSGYRRLYLGNLLKSFKGDNKYSKDSYALITQITTISKKRIFNCKICDCCHKDIMDTINNAIIDFLIK